MDLLILVTLGTQDKKFIRLLKAIEKQIKLGNIKDKVIVQAGCTADFKSDKMEIFDLIPIDEFDNLIKECNILITHGGVGSIIAGLKHEKKVIAIPRLSRYGEHTNDHQEQIVKNFSKEGYILTIEDLNQFDKVLKKVKNFKPKKYKTNNKKFVKLIENFIDNI